jgi:hypothetical protein
MALNLSALSSITAAAKTISNVILVTPLVDQGIQPLPATASAEQEDGAQELVPILFDFQGEQTVDLSSDITDHYTEDNQALQDQIALRPEIIRTQGYISDLNDIVPDALKPLQTALTKLTPLTAYTPELTLTAIRAYNLATTAYAVGKLGVTAAVSKWGGDSTQQNKQQAAYLRFMGYWKERRLFKVQTPWCIFPFCAIQNVRAVQDAETRTISTFDVTFKTIRFARTLNSGIVDFGQGRFNNQAAPLLNNGNSTPASSVGLGTQLGSSFPGNF